MSSSRVTEGHVKASPAPPLTLDGVWRAIERGSFAVLSHVTAAGDPRSSGVMYTAVDRRLYVVTAADSWKARQIADGDRVAVTIPVRRGGLLSLIAPIPPATVSFTARATVHPAGSMQIAEVSPRFAKLLPADRRDGCVIELVPVGRFVTYGLGVSLTDMRNPATSMARVPVGEP